MQAARRISKTQCEKETVQCPDNTLKNIVCMLKYNLSGVLG